MKFSKMFILAGVLALLAIPLAAQTNASHSKDCTVASLKGTFGFFGEAPALLIGDPTLRIQIVGTIRFDGQQSRRLPLPEGETLQAQWVSDGHALEYLSRPADPRKLTALREWTQDNGSGPGRDVRIADTSQFVRFQANSDASVYVGARGSQASPYLLLLIRAAHRELTLAEHRASDASLVTPAFAPNSQFVVFVSDRHGKPAIYWIAVDKLVTETDGS